MVDVFHQDDVFTAIDGYGIGTLGVSRITCYAKCMIKGFRCSDTEELFNRVRVKRFVAIRNQLERSWNF
jgi:hypothetical protein